MATCRYCGAWVAGTADVCGKCKRRMIREPRWAGKVYYNKFIRGKKLI